MNEVHALIVLLLAISVILYYISACIKNKFTYFRYEGTTLELTQEDVTSIESKLIQSYWRRNTFVLTCCGRFTFREQQGSDGWLRAVIGEWQKCVGSGKAWSRRVSLCFSPIPLLSNQIKPRVRRPQIGAERPGSSALNGPVSAVWMHNVLGPPCLGLLSTGPLIHHRNYNRQLHSECHTNPQSLLILLSLQSHLCLWF